MAFSQRSVLFMALLCLVFIACVAAADRQPLFADQAHLTAGARNLPQRFQEMVQRRRLASTPTYGSYSYGTYGVYGR